MLFCASGEAEKHPRGPEAIARLSSLLLHLSKWPHLFPRVVSVWVSALFLMENESPAKILTRFSTVFLHSLHFSSMRASISSQRRDEALFPPSTLWIFISILSSLCFSFVIFMFSLFYISLISGLSWKSGIYLFYSCLFLVFLTLLFLLCFLLLSVYLLEEVTWSDFWSMH